jgi:DNA-binding CsgD family transcriptional regulator
MRLLNQQNQACYLINPVGQSLASIAGGRKIMALYGMLTAQLLFDDDDCLWYLYSTGDFLKEKRLHPEPGDQAHLVPIPVVRWARISPVLLDLARFDDPFQALQRQEDLRLEERLEEAHSFVRGALTAAEARVVALLVRDGISDVEIAHQLVVSPRTVSDHLRTAYQKAAAHWNLPDVDRSQLIQLLYFYFLDPEWGNP